MDQTTTQTPVAAPTPAPTKPVNDVEENKDIAALGYAWVLAVFVYFWKKDSPFVRFHAKQGIVLFIISIVVWMVPVFGRFLELLVLALCVLGFLSAAQGQHKDLPIIGDMAEGKWSHVRQSWRDIVSSIAHLWKRVHHFLRKEKHAAPATAEASAATPAAVVPVTPVPVAPPVVVTPVQSSAPIAETPAPVQTPAPTVTDPNSPPPPTL